MTLLNALKLPPSLVVILECDEDICIERLKNTKIDPVTGLVYDMATNPPKEDNIKRRLTSNPEDEEEIVRKR